MSATPMKATSTSFPNTPMPERRLAVVLDRRYTPLEYERLANGEVPSSQDDRWFTWVDDDHVVHVHRSWSGFEIYEIRLVRIDDHYEVAAAWVNADPDQHRPDPRMDEAVLGPLLDRLARR